MSNFWSNKRITVTGGAGFLGSHITEALKRRGVSEEQIFVPRSRDCDLREFANCQYAVGGKDVVIHLAARVGGIGFLKERPGEVFYDNIIMGSQVMEAARQAGVKKFVAVGTSCAYPKLTPVPFREEDFWAGYPEAVSAPYGLAKKMLLVQAQAYRAQYGFDAVFLLPANLYGPGDNFDPASSHVVPALIKKIVEAKRDGRNFVEVWGTGNATRDFLYAPDAAAGIIRAAEHYNGPEPVNLGSGQELSIRHIVDVIADIVGYHGEIRWDPTKPDGQPRRSLDTRWAKEDFGFVAATPIGEGLRRTIEWYQSEKCSAYER